MAEQPSRKRRIVKRAVWPLAIVCSIASYLGSYGSVNWYIGSEIRAGKKVSPRVIWAQRKIFAPIVMYEKTDWPGARALVAFRIWSLNEGNVTWERAIMLERDDADSKMLP